MVDASRGTRISLDKLIYDNYGMCKFVNGFVYACFVSTILIARIFKLARDERDRADENKKRCIMLAKPVYER